MNRRVLPTSSVGVALVLFFAVNVVSAFALRGARADLTEDELFTLSDGTVNILSSLDEPVTLRLFYSEELTRDVPDLQAYAQRVREMLEEFAAVSGGMVRFEEADPEPFSEVEDLAVAYGLRGIVTGLGGEVIYFGLVGTNLTDDERVIPVFDRNRQQFLEYDLAEIVHDLAHPEKRRIGVISSLPLDGAPANPMLGGGSEPWLIMSQLRQLFDVEVLGTNVTELDRGLDALLVVHPKQLPDSTRYAIDQYVLGGGKAMLFVDPFCEADRPPTDPNNPMAAMMADRSSDLPELLAAWGVSWESDLVAGDAAQAMKVRGGTQNRPEVVDYLPWITLGPASVVSDDIVTQSFTRVSVAAPGALRPADGASTTFEPLLQTSEDSTLLPRTSVQFMPDPKRLLNEFVPAGERLTIAARVSGPCSSAFPDGPPGATGADEGEGDADDDAAAADDDDDAHLAESTGDVNLIVVADADLLEDQWWAQASRFLGLTQLQVIADNAALVLNGLENLTGSSDLISVRSRGRFTRPFETLLEIQREAEERFRAEEQALVAELEATEERLTQLQSERDPETGGDVLILTPEQEAELERFAQKRVETRQRLRQVRYEQREDIEAVQSRIKALNILAMPLLVVIAARVNAIGKRRRRRREF